MPKCRSCDSFVTQRYVRVFAPDTVEKDGEVRACPHCTMTRDGGNVRRARSRANPEQEGPIQ